MTGCGSAELRTVIHTDGSCLGNPGPGGWAAIVAAHEGDKLLRRKDISGGEIHTTNNRMELMGPIKALRGLKVKDRPIVIISDSKYVVDGMTEWLPKWKANGWRKANGKAVQHRDLWEELDALSERHSAEWQWVRGHNGDPLNEEAHRLARAEAEKARRQAGNSGRGGDLLL